MAEESSKLNVDEEYEFQIDNDFVISEDIGYQFCGSLLIINIDETQKEICKGCFVKKLRTGAEREVKCLQGTFCGENYRQKEIGEKDGRNLDAEIEEYIAPDKGNKD